jgi:hypothetical protein
MKPDRLVKTGKEALCNSIREAFAGVTLGSGIGLQQAQGIDDYEDEATCARYRAADEKEDWSRIPASELNRCNSSLSFFDAEGMRFHLPAFLIADLQGAYGFGMAFCFTQSHDYDHYFGLLSDAQRKVVREFLLHISEEPDYKWERPHIVRALHEYWNDRRFLWNHRNV